MSRTPDPRVLTKEAESRVHSFDPLQVMQRMGIAVGNSRKKDEFLLALKQQKWSSLKNFFQDESHTSEDVKQPTLAQVGKLVAILDHFGINFSLDDAVRADHWQSDVPYLLHNIEQRLDRVLEFDRVAYRSLQRFIPELEERLGAVLRSEREAIMTVQTDQRAGHIAGFELENIGECSDHLRIVANHLNFGVAWDEMTGKAEGNELHEFNVMVHRLQTTRWTFVLPDHSIPAYTEQTGVDGNGVGPSWRQRVTQFRDHFRSQGGVSNDVWDERVLFAYSRLPIPVSYILYGLGKEGLTRLRHGHPEIIEILESDGGKHWIQTEDGGAFIGVVVPRHGVAKFASLLDRHALLYASHGFMQHWDSTKQDVYPIPHPCIGLPKSLDGEFRAGLDDDGALFGDTDVKPGLPRVEVRSDN